MGNGDSTKRATSEGGQLDPIAFVVAFLRHPAVQSALREAFGAAAGDELIPLARLAEQVDTEVRNLTDEGRRGRLTIEGPRCARVVRRSERDRWLAAEGPRAKAKAPTKAANDTDERADDRAAMARAAARKAR